MILDLILGKNIDTLQWIEDLKKSGADYIIVLDYDLEGNYEIVDDITYASIEYAVKNLKKYDSINYYKSLYVYPGMSGSMSSVQKHD